MNYGKLFLLNNYLGHILRYMIYILCLNLLILSLLNSTLEDAAKKYNASYHPLLESYEEYENVSKNEINKSHFLDFARGIERGKT